MRVCIIDYDAGNIGSVQSALAQFHCAATISCDPKEILNADKLILPGVGSFHSAMQALHDRNLVQALNQAVIENGIPILGICLGMQLFATLGYEGGKTTGLNYIPGEVAKITPSENLRLPHIGWNALDITQPPDLFDDIPNNLDFYFLHSYEYLLTESQYGFGWTRYGKNIIAAIRNKNVFGVQFHPEKSGKYGLKLLKNFIEMTTG